MAVLMPEERDMGFRQAEMTGVGPGKTKHSEWVLNLWRMEVADIGNKEKVV